MSDLVPVGLSIRWTFDCMEIAERALKGRDAPGKFRILIPTDLLCMSLRLYEKHVSELMDRMSNRQDTRPPTKAEMLGAMSGLSLDAPLNTEGMIVYEHLFSDLFPDQFNWERTREQWSGQLVDMLTVLRKKLSQPWRLMERQISLWSSQ